MYFWNTVEKWHFFYYLCVPIIRQLIGEMHRANQSSSVPCDCCDDQSPVFTFESSSLLLLLIISLPIHDVSVAFPPSPDLWRHGSTPRNMVCQHFTSELDPIVNIGGSGKNWVSVILVEKEVYYSQSMGRRKRVTAVSS